LISSGPLAQFHILESSDLLLLNLYPIWILRMAEEGYKVSLNVYDLSQGLARQLSMTFLGKAIEGVW
jgi:hypothetical protein